MSQVLLVADDLTGGNATGAMFSRRGLRTVSVGPQPEHWDAVAATDVVVVNTDTRRPLPGLAADLVARVVHDFRPAPRLLVKRVDTTLRGPVAAELEATLTARGPGRPGSGLDSVLSRVRGGLQLDGGVPLAAQPGTAVGGSGSSAARAARAHLRPSVRAPRSQW